MDVLDPYSRKRSEWPMRGDEPLFETTDAKPEVKEAPGCTGTPAVVTVDATGKEVIAIVPVKAEAGYLLARDSTLLLLPDQYLVGSPCLIGREPPPFAPNEQRILELPGT